MRGYIDPATNYPLIELAVNGRTLACLIDTGFTGDLAVGQEKARELGLGLTGQKHFSKTAGGDILTRSVDATLLWFGHSRDIRATVFPQDGIGPADGLIGIHLLIGYILVIDLNEGDVVVKDPSLLTTLG